MANFTDQELQDAVSKVVRATVRNPTGVLGERQVETSFNDLQEAAAGVYILYFNAPYYTLLLGARRLQDSLTSQASTIASLVDAVLATKRAVTPVNDLTSLANAKAALDELSSAVSTRTEGFQDIHNVPAFRRYAANLDAFLSSAGSNVKGASSDASAPITGAPAIVDTPAGARSIIPGLVRQLKAQQDELVRRAGLFSAALTNFTALNLPQIAAEGVISNSASILAGHYADLAALDENSRLENLRAVVLDLLTQRPLVEAYGAGQAPSEYIRTSGIARAFSDSIHPATPAELTADKAGPYNLTTANHSLNLAIDHGTSFSFPLPLGYVAEINGTLSEPFTLGSDSTGLSVEVVEDGSTFRATTTFSSGTNTADDIVSRLNSVLSATTVDAEKYFSPLRLDTIMAMTPLVGTTARFTVLAGDITGHGLTVGNEVDVLSGPNQGTTWAITVLTPTSIDVAGGYVAIADPEAAVQAGPSARAIRLRDTQASSSLATRRTIRLVAGDNTAAYLGFFPGIESRSRPVLADELAVNINASTSLFAASVLDVPMYEGGAHGNLADPSLVTLSIFQGRGTTDGGLTAILYMADGTDLSALVPGMKLVVRSSETAEDINDEGTVTGVGNGEIDVTFSTTLTAGDVAVEVGPAFTAPFTFGTTLIIKDGPNQGRYYAREASGIGTTCSFELLIDRPLPSPKTGSTVNSFNVELCESLVQFGSPSKLLTSEVFVAPGVGAEVFFEAGELPAQAIGMTEYLQFDVYPTAAAVGDIVELYVDQYNVVSREFSILGTEPNNRVLLLSDAVASDYSITFDSNVPNPFARIRIEQTANYAAFKESLDVWLANPVLTTQYYRDLARFLNPVLTNSNPTSAAVDDAANQLKKLSAILSVAAATAYGSTSLPQPPETYTLEYALNLYESPVEPAVDVLISSFRNKGADRAVDLLLEGQFSAFFGLDLNTVSYSGALTQAARDMAMNDLPIRKVDRRNATNQQLIGTISNETDFEFDTSDADSVDIPDPQ